MERPASPSVKVAPILLVLGAVVVVVAAALAVKSGSAADDKPEGAGKASPAHSGPPRVRSSQEMERSALAVLAEADPELERNIEEDAVSRVNAQTDRAGSHNVNKSDAYLKHLLQAARIEARRDAYFVIRFMAVAKRMSEQGKCPVDRWEDIAAKAWRETARAPIYHLENEEQRETADIEFRMRAELDRAAVKARTAELAKDR